jgi:hypothetical protein
MDAMNRDKIASVVAAVMAFLAMVGLLTLLGGHLDRMAVLMFSAGSVVVGLRHSARRRRHRP